MADVFRRNNRTVLAVNLFFPAHASGICVVFSHDRGGATLWNVAGGDRRLQTIGRPALFERIRQVISAG